MFCLRTERLQIIVVPSDIPLPEARKPRRAEQLISRLERENRASNAESLLAKQNKELLNSITCYLYDRGNATFVGYVSSTFFTQTGICYFGFHVEAEFEGMGFATEAASAVTKALIAVPEVKAIVSEAHPDSIASLKVMQKVGLKQIEANLGPHMVRHALVKPGETVKLVEDKVVTLGPYCPTNLYQRDYLFRYQVSRMEDLMVLFTLVASAIGLRESEWVILFILCILGYSSYLTVRFVRWAKIPGVETIFQLRSSGFFYANRSGFGGITPWNEITHFRNAQKGGLECFSNGSWFQICEQMFSEGQLAEAKAMLKEFGVTCADPS